MDIRNGLITAYAGISASVGASSGISFYKNSGSYFNLFNNGRLWIGSGTPVDAGYTADIRGTSQFADNINISAGKRITWDSTNQVILGYLATGSGIAIGNSAAAFGGGMAIGYQASTTNHVVESAIGYLAKTAGGFEPATAIGAYTFAGGNSIAMNTAYAAAGNTFIAGSGWDGKAITNVYFGSGIERGSFYNGSLTYWSGSGTGYTINGAGAFGLNFAGGNLILAGGKGTGTGSSGDIIFSVASVGSAGSSLQSLSNRWYIKGNSGTLANRNISYTSSFAMDISGLVGITGSIIMTGSIFMSPSSSFVLPLTASSSPLTGSAYWSGSSLFIWNGTRYMSSSFA